LKFLKNESVIYGTDHNMICRNEWTGNGCVL